jgi:hypothetical protein
LETLDELFGTGAGVILYHFGRGVGRNMLPDLDTGNTQEVPATVQLERIRLFAKNVTRKGWCELDMSEKAHTEESVIFMVRKLPVHDDKTNTNYEMIIRGICCGFLEKVWGGNVSILRGSTKDNDFELVASKGGFAYE